MDLEMFEGWILGFSGYFLEAKLGSSKFRADCTKWHDLTICLDPVREKRTHAQNDHTYPPNDTTPTWVGCLPAQSYTGIT